MKGGGEQDVFVPAAVRQELAALVADRTTGA
jgi:hypothetical protein